MLDERSGSDRLGNIEELKTTDLEGMLSGSDSGYERRNSAVNNDSDPGSLTKEETKVESGIRRLEHKFSIEPAEKMDLE